MAPTNHLWRSKMTYSHAIIYIGAPYGENEHGHIYSQHRSVETAQRRYSKDFSGTVGYKNHRIVALDAQGDWTVGEFLPVN